MLDHDGGRATKNTRKAHSTARVDVATVVHSNNAECTQQNTSSCSPRCVKQPHTSSLHHLKPRVFTLHDAAPPSKESLLAVPPSRPPPAPPCLAATDQVLPPCDSTPADESSSPVLSSSSQPAVSEPTTCMSHARAGRCRAVGWEAAPVYPSMPCSMCRQTSQPAQHQRATQAHLAAAWRLLLLCAAAAAMSWATSCLAGPLPTALFTAAATLRVGAAAAVNATRRCCRAALAGVAAG